MATSGPVGSIRRRKTAAGLSSPQSSTQESMFEALSWWAVGPAVRIIFLSFQVAQECQLSYQEREPA